MTTKNNIPAGYKDSAVGIIPQEWEVKRLGNIAKCFSGGTPKSESEEMYGGTIPFIRSGEIHSDKTALFLTDDGLRKSSAKMVDVGDLIFALYGANSGDCAISQINGAINQAILCIRSSSVINPFMQPYLELQKDRFIAKYLQGGQGNLSGEIVCSYTIPIPPLAEQRKIAEILGVWDEAIEKQSRLIEKLELRKRALMQRLLTGRTRLPGFTTPWQKVKLGEIGKFDKGVGVPKEKIVSEGCKAITYGEIYTKYNYVIKDFASYIDSDTAQTSKQISSGAIIFAGSGETLEDIGKCVAFIDNDKAYAGGDIIIFNPSIEVDSLVLSYILNSPVAIAQKRRYGQGHSVVHIYQKDLARIEFELPSLPEQKAIAEVLTTADDEIATHRKKLDALRLQKRGLMQQLLTGKTRVKI